MILEEVPNPPGAVRNSEVGGRFQKIRLIANLRKNFAFTVELLPGFSDRDSRETRVGRCFKPTPAILA
ncbi:unnamed protein product [Mesocestoides corti]|uniref:Kinesin motor domain-containing protein n=1 Tax=Mesocestoides corti TaxID=53468 RepID=A0A0R3U9V0_MESCO|nr:unnamed protein product [Mesocestoides corti]